jgi:8-oxo-dGTP pyrophosphatase MutT (NUDIX family)
MNAHQPVALPETSKQSAVLIIIVYDEQEKMSLVVTKRSNTITYAGDYCFPGGSRDESDINFIFTAKREVKEELGILEQYYQVIGQLDDFVDRYGHRVLAYVAMMKKMDFEQHLNASSNEVAEIYFFPIEELPNIKTNDALEQVTRRHPSYLYVDQDVIIWGLTASIMVDLGNILLGLNRPVCKKIILQIENK